MANEITVTTALRYSKNGASASLSTSFSQTQVGDKYEGGVQVIGTSEESLAKGDVGTIGYIAIRNLDSTNFVQLGHTTGVYDIKILAGKGTVVPWGSTANFVKADTAACNVEYLIIEL